MPQRVGGIYRQDESTSSAALVVTKRLDTALIVYNPAQSNKRGGAASASYSTLSRVFQRHLGTLISREFALAAFAGARLRWNECSSFETATCWGTIRVGLGAATRAS